MECRCHVQGDNVDELRANADQLAADFANGADYTVKLDEAGGGFGPAGETDGPRFGAFALITVTEPPKTTRREPGQ